MSPAKPHALTTYVALLRGINLGAKNKVSMPALRSVVESLGHEDVLTYIQSGNVVFKSRSRESPGIAKALEDGIAEEFGLRVAVVVRTQREWQRVAGRAGLVHHRSGVRHRRGPHPVDLLSRA